MSSNYTPTKWIGGRTIGTADVMNNIENGILEAHNRLDKYDMLNFEIVDDFGAITQNSAHLLELNFEYIYEG